MSKFYPRGTFGPVCDIQPSDDTLRNRPRRLPEDDDDDRIETIPIDIDFPDIINSNDPTTFQELISRYSSMFKCFI